MSTISFSSSSGLSAGYTTTGYHKVDESILSGTTYVNDFPLNTSVGTTVSPGILTISNNQSKIMQNKVAVFKVTRNDENEIISSEFIKEMWVQTKGNQKVDFEVARDKDLAKYKAEDLDIRILFFVNY
jgi:hypothetical protein